MQPWSLIGLLASCNCVLTPAILLPSSLGQFLLLWRRLRPLMACSTFSRVGAGYSLKR